MKKQLIFNELCKQIRVSSIYEANMIIKDFLDCIKFSFEIGFKKVQVENDFRLYILCGDYTIEDWLNSNETSHTLKALLLSSIVHPYINDKDDEIIYNDFIRCKFKFDEDHNLKGQNSIGLGIAYLFQKFNSMVLGISFLNDTIFDNSNLKLLQEESSSENKVIVKHISKLDHLNTHMDWFNTIDVKIIESSIMPEHKKINIRDDHGKDILFAFAKKLVKCIYVNEIINSLPFNANIKRFIKETKENGIIEVVLHREDKGYGLVIKTTGRNLSETKKIANIIENEFYK